MKNATTTSNEFQGLRKKLGEQIQGLRKAKGMTQEELADRAGLDRVSVGYIEQGIRAPKLSTLFTLSKVLQVDLKDLFTFDR